MTPTPDDRWPPSELVTLLEDAVHALLTCWTPTSEERIVRVAVLPTLRDAGWLRTSPVTFVGEQSAEWVTVPPGGIARGDTLRLTADGTLPATSATLSAQRREGGPGSQWPPDALVQRCVAALAGSWRDLPLEATTAVVDDALVRAVLAEVRRTDVTP